MSRYLLPLTYVSAVAIACIWILAAYLLPDFFSWDGSMAAHPQLSALIVLALVPWSVIFGVCLGRLRKT